MRVGWIDTIVILWDISSPIEDEIIVHQDWMSSLLMSKLRLLIIYIWSNIQGEKRNGKTHVIYAIVKGKSCVQIPK